MGTASVETQPAITHTDEAILRANTYSLLASLLRSPPDQGLLAILMQIDTRTEAHLPLENAWQNLSRAAADSEPELLDDEYHALFIGLGHGEVIPYSSWYQTGFLMDKPLALLRQSMAALGLARRNENYEPEDHIAALCECMAILIDDGVELDIQRSFYQTHMLSWLRRCFDDIAQAPSANFYQHVAALGRQFSEVEQRYLDIGDS